MGADPEDATRVAKRMRTGSVEVNGGAYNPFAIEVPVKRILRGYPAKALQPDAVDRPDLIGFYRTVGDRRRKSAFVE